MANHKIVNFIATFKVSGMLPARNKGFNVRASKLTDFTILYEAMLLGEEGETLDTIMHNKSGQIVCSAVYGWDVEAAKKLGIRTAGGRKFFRKVKMESFLVVCAYPDGTTTNRSFEAEPNKGAITLAAWAVSPKDSTMTSILHNGVIVWSFGYGRSHPGSDGWTGNGLVITE